MVKTTLILIIILLCSVNSFCQTYYVNGRVLTDSHYVNCAALVLYNSQTNTVIDSTTTDSFGYYQLNAVVGVDDNHPTIPTNFELAQNYPNPFSNQTEILYKLNKQNEVTIKIYDILGREIKTFRQGEQNIGIHGVRWDGTNNHGIKAVPGIYFYQLITNKEIQTMKMVYSPNGDSFVKNGNRFVTINNQLRLTKKTNTAWNRFTFEIKSIDSTKPEIVIQRFEDLPINRDTTIEFNVEKARIILGQSIEGVKIGDDSLTVINKLGIPDLVYDADLDGYVFAYSDESHSGFELYVTIIKNPQFIETTTAVISIEANVPYKGKTKEGIKIGMYRDIVLNLLGAPLRTDPGPPLIVDYYYIEPLPGYMKTGFWFTYDENKNVFRMQMMLDSQ